MVTKKDIARLNALLYLDAFTECRSKREASKHLGVSVDTINKYIGDLEEELKIVLLSGNGRGSIITPEGERFLSIADNIIKCLRNLDDIADEVGNYQGIVRFAVNDSAAGDISSKKLFDFIKQYPGIHLYTILGNKRPSIAMMETDILVDYAPPREADAVIIAEKDVRFGLFASSKYLEEFGIPKNMNDLYENHRVCYKTGYLMNLKKPREFLSKAKHIIYTTNSIMALKSVLKSGVGIGICPYSYKGILMPLDHLHFEFTSKIYLIAHRDTKDNPRIRVVLDYAKKLLDEKFGGS